MTKGTLCACFAIVLAVVLPIAMRKAPVEDIYSEELIVAPVDSGKPTTGHKIGIKCYSLYPENTINLDVFITQRLFEHEKKKSTAILF